jgi:very-short-patch-repair endonuclease/ribosomal protein S27AE
MPWKLTTEKFIEKAKKIHGEKYDYSKVIYTHSNIKVLIGCKEHGYFLQIPSIHLQKKGCPLCSKNYHINTEEFIKRAIKKHGDRYDYSEVKYANSLNDIIIICKEHGKFYQNPSIHLQGSNCPRCHFDSLMSSAKRFIEKAKKIHGKKYDYSEIKYKHSRIPVTIICKEHGKFSQTPTIHLQNKGCPQCSASKGETKILNWLSLNKIKFIPEKRFSTCKNKKTLPFDFFLPDHNLIIEYDGLQHFLSGICKRFSKKRIDKIRHHDCIKNEFCIENHINLLRIPYTEFSRIEIILESILNKPVPASNIVPFFFNQSKTKTILEEAVS